MTDLDMTRLCAEAMGLQVIGRDSSANASNVSVAPNCTCFDPLHDDTQAFALVKRFRIGITAPGVDGGLWGAMCDAGGTVNNNLNAAIVECVAKMQVAKVKP